MSASTRTIAILQPGYVPWLGFFDQVLRSDVFVIYDDVQFDKQGWRNRNRIKSANGVQWLTVPVLHRGRSAQLIPEVEINNSVPWGRKHLAAIRQCYAKAPFLDQYATEIEQVLAGPWTHLIDLDREFVGRMCSWLGVRGELVRSSELGIRGDRTERLVKICKALEASRYLTGDAARSYLDPTEFEKNGIRVEFQNYQHPTYPQLHGDFVPYLSALDLLLNCGDESARILRGEQP